MGKVGGIDLSGDSLGLNKFFKPEKIREQRLQPYQEKLDKVTLELEKAGGTGNALTGLAAKVESIRNAAADLTSGSGINKRTYDVTTNELNGSGTDYVSVTKTAGSASIGSINVQVNQVATYAHTDVDKNGLGGFTLMEDISLGGANNLQITITNAGAAQPPINIPINAGDTIQTLANKCNAQLVGTDVTATLGRTGNNYYLKLKSTVTGNRQIAVAGTGNVGTGGAINQVNGTDAAITVDGKNLTGTSNTFNDIENGVSIEVKKTNTLGRSQTVNIKNDPEAASKSILDFVTSYNHFLEFTAKQTERDPQTFAPLEDAFLVNDPTLASAKRMMDVISGKAGIPNQPLNSLAAMGITLEDIPATNEAPAMQQFKLTDPEKFKDSVYNNFDNLRALFQDTFTATPQPGNLGSSITGTVQENLNSAVLGQNIEVIIGWVNGAIASADFSLDGGANWINGTVDAATNSITLQGTPLEGLKVNFQSNGIGNSAERFTMNVTQGIANKATLLSDSLKDTINRGIRGERDKARELEARKISAQEALDKKAADVEAFLARIDAMILRASISMARIRARFGE